MLGEWDEDSRWDCSSGLSYNRPIFRHSYHRKTKRGTGKSTVERTEVTVRALCRTFPFILSTSVFFTHHTVKYSGASQWEKRNWRKSFSIYILSLLTFPADWRDNSYGGLLKQTLPVSSYGRAFWSRSERLHGVWWKLFLYFFLIVMSQVLFLSQTRANQLNLFEDC